MCVDLGYAGTGGYIYLELIILTIKDVYMNYKINQILLPKIGLFGAYCIVGESCSNLLI